MLKVKDVRKARGLSVPALGELTGLHRRTIEGIEKRGDCLVSNLSIIAEALGVTLNDLWEPDIVEKKTQEV